MRRAGRNGDARGQRSLLTSVGLWVLTSGWVIDEVPSWTYMYVLIQNSPPARTRVARADEQME